MGGVYVTGTLEPGLRWRKRDYRTILSLLE